MENRKEIARTTVGQQNLERPGPARAAFLVSQTSEWMELGVSPETALRLAGESLSAMLHLLNRERAEGVRDVEKD